MSQSMVLSRIRSKKDERDRILQRVSEEQIKPTKDEKSNMNRIIERISIDFRNDLNNPETDNEDLEDRLREAIKNEISRMNLPYESQKRLEKLAIANIIGLGPIQEYLEMETVTEILVQRYDNICVEQDGKIIDVGASFTDETHLRNVINRILQPIGRAVNMKTPIVDARLADGSRVCATIPPVSPNGATLTIRKFNSKMMTYKMYIDKHSLDIKTVKFLRMCVRGKISIFVSGGTGTGKTTFLNMLSSFIPKDEILITIEDTMELQLQQKNVRSLEVRQVNNENTMLIDMPALVKASLRMRPDRIVVGEVRDGAVVALLTAMSTGHEGSMSTGHANSPFNLVNVRIPTMMEMDKDSKFSERAQALMISEGIRLIVQLERFSGRRVLSHVTEVGGVDENGQVELHDIIRYNKEKDTYDYTGYFPKRVAETLDYYGYKLTEDLFLEEQSESVEE